MAGHVPFSVSADEPLCDELLARLVANDTWLAPTLTVLRSMASLQELRVQTDPHDRYMPSAIVEGWRAPLPGMELTTPDDIEAGNRCFARQIEVTGRAAAAGVGILAGTDTPNPFVYPGFSLHDELGLLVEAVGSSNRAALNAMLEDVLCERSGG